MAQTTENSGPGKKKKLVPGQSPAARKSAVAAAGAKAGAKKQEMQAAARAAGMQKRSGVHVVKRGDTLSAIAKANNTTVAKLKELNPVAAKKGIFSGTKIRIRPSAAATSMAQAKKKQGAQAAAKVAGMKSNYLRRVSRGD